MIGWLALAAAATGPTALDAERAFAAEAKAKGQWTAFRHYAAPDAIMFVPEQVEAQAWLKDRADPPHSVEWTATASYVSCDGGTAANTGEWRWPDGSVGYFTTVWARQADGQWRWLLHHGDTLRQTRPVDRPVVDARRPTGIRRAACQGTPSRQLHWSRAYRFAGLQRGGRSADGRLAWGSRIWSLDRPLPRWVWVQLWTGENWEEVLSDDVSAPR